MPLAPGTHLGPHEIVSLLGSGGMGEVYRAHDARLNRDVAVKVSGERFTERFEREARVIASLNHPHICHLYDVGPDYLVMELVEGDTLAEIIGKGAIPPAEALRYAAQIAEALDAAHAQGIVHRDLKPANVKVTPGGTVKVLDFGLAKVGGTATAHSDHPPTISLAATQAGMIVGTAAYMAPEQARGKPVDKRADIWAFGVVLYEMLTGERLFEGEDVSEVLAAVIKDEPRWDRVPANTRRLLKKCLQKDPTHRLRDIGDAWDLLEEVADPTRAQPSAGLRPWLGAVAWGVAALVTLALGVLAFIHFREQTALAEPVRFQIPPPGKTAITSLSVSPDGRRVAFTARTADSGRGSPGPARP